MNICHECKGELIRCLSFKVLFLVLFAANKKKYCQTKYEKFFHRNNLKILAINNDDEKQHEYSRTPLKTYSIIIYQILHPVRMNNTISLIPACPAIGRTCPAIGRTCPAISSTYHRFRKASAELLLRSTAEKEQSQPTVGPPRHLSQGDDAFGTKWLCDRLSQTGLF
jgi:hypothetical protein